MSGAVGAKEGEEEEEEEVFAADDGAGATALDVGVGLLEELVMEPGFVEEQEAFLKKHRPAFGDAEKARRGEQKLEWTEVHAQFVSRMDEVLTVKLTEGGVDPAAFASDLEAAYKQRASGDTEALSLEGDLWDTLFSLVDYAAFLDLILSYPLNPPASPYAASPTAGAPTGLALTGQGAHPKKP